MIGWLKRLVAGRELAELDRWRFECSHAARWLAEFPDAESALGYVRSAVGAGGGNIVVVHKNMRLRRDGSLPPIDGNALVCREMIDEEFDTFRVHWDRALRTAKGAPLEIAKDEIRRAMFPEPDRIAYRFLSAECADAS